MAGLPCANACRLELQIFGAILGAERHGDRALRPWRLDAVFAEIARQIAAEDLLFRVAFLETGAFDESQSLRRDRADAVEDIERHAARVRNNALRVRFRVTRSTLPCSTRIDFQGFLDAALGEFVLIVLREHRFAVLAVDIVVPAVAQIAFRADLHAIGRYDADRRRGCRLRCRGGRFRASD